MRPVNLLPVRYRPRVAGSRNPKIAYITIGVLAAFVLAVFGYVAETKKVSSRNAEIARVQQQITEVETQAVTLQGFGDFASIKQGRLSAVKALAAGRLDWERLFRELAHVLPARVWLTGFNGQPSSGAADSTGGTGEAGQTVVLEGCADGHRQVADVMVRLRQLHAAKDVELTETMATEEDEDDASSALGGETEGGCGRYYSFTISVELNVPMPDGPAAARAVPARLGGGE